MKNMENLYQHGGNIYEVKQRLALDFSANINSLGIPPRIKKLLSNQLKDLIHYPDPEAHRLVAALARYWKVKEENVLVGNGSTELIYLILNAFRPDKVTLPVPSFTEYERAARISGSQVRFIHMLEGESFSLNFDHINNCDMLFICNPNNPTGNLIVSNRADIKNIPAKRIVIDEAFMDFVPDEKRYTLIPEAVRSKKIIVLRTLTKFFALPGLRVGYLIAHHNIIRMLKEYQMPWSVNLLAQVAAEQCLGEEAFIQRSKQLVEKERSFLYERLDRIKELKPYLSMANFLLVKIKNKGLASSCLKERLLKRGILIRDCANFRGLNKQFIRVVVRTHQENNQLAQILEECV
ncbi:MAG: threonine-phosphate decarboxylase [Syntrophaceae bacterium]|nr:threonine-phosphate decarboxylase [Syntrophaceae bacterium]